MLQVVYVRKVEGSHSYLTGINPALGVNDLGSHPCRGVTLAGESRVPLTIVSLTRIALARPCEIMLAL